MKKNYLAMLMGCLMIMNLSACGNEDEVKIVDKVPSTQNQEVEKQESENLEENKESASSAETLKGYIYEAQANGKSVSVVPDMDMSAVLEELGEANSYFQAASCAFEGLDKVYTYDHFQIETYPDGDVDKISLIVFLDDLTETKEGVAIGMTKEEVEASYGADYEEKQNVLVYTKDGMHLTFILKDGIVESIEYTSSVMDNA